MEPKRQASLSILKKRKISEIAKSCFSGIKVLINIRIIKINARKKFRKFASLILLSTAETNKNYL